VNFGQIEASMREVGFHTTWDNDSRRLLCASQLRPDGGLTGNSFWIAQRSCGWFLGTWGPHLYRIPDSDRVAELCVTWLKKRPAPTEFDVDDSIKQTFQLLEIESDALPPQ
jgi:hypothetical protein